jgi:hypothetical protein
VCVVRWFHPIKQKRKNVVPQNVSSDQERKDPKTPFFFPFSYKNLTGINFSCRFVVVVVWNHNNHVAHFSSSLDCIIIKWERIKHSG